MQIAMVPSMAPFLVGRTDSGRLAVFDTKTRVLGQDGKTQVICTLVGMYSTEAATMYV